MTLNLAASTVAGAAYNWMGPNGFASTIQNPSLARADQSASGVYRVTATAGGLTSAAGTVAVTVNPPVLFSVQMHSGKLILGWPYGVLQSATNVLGPWSAIAGATSPFTNLPAGPEQFYRVQLQ
jgi:hypothetical protein